MSNNIPTFNEKSALLKSADDLDFFGRAAYMLGLLVYVGTVAITPHPHPDKFYTNTEWKGAGVLVASTAFKVGANKAADKRREKANGMKFEVPFDHPDIRV